MRDNYKIVNGNIFDSKADVIVHQVNCLGIMGGGIAWQIRNKYPEHYEDYVAFCNKYDMKGVSPLGEYVMTDTKDFKIVGIFGQSEVGHHGCYTDYAAVEKALEDLSYDFRLQEGKKHGERVKIAFPYKMSCGLAGGNWNVIEPMIKRIFAYDPFRNMDFDIEVWKYDQA